jgi:hypothetical protein
MAVGTFRAGGSRTPRDQVLNAVTDGVKGMEQALEAMYPVYTAV